MSFSVTILGSSSALPTSERSLTAHLVNHDERFFLIDCGEGTQIQLKKLKTKTGKINHIFISHLHGDHVFGLFGLLSSFSLQGRNFPIHIYCHSKLEEILKFHFEQFNEYISYKIEYHHLNNKSKELIYEDKKLEAYSFPLKHRIPCSGFLFKEKTKERNIKKYYIEELGLGIKDILAIKEGQDFIKTNGEIVSNEIMTTPPPASRSYAFCTDTKVHEGEIKFIEGADLLYHESTFLHTDEKLAKETYHSTAKQAAQIATKANVKKLVLGHFSQRYKNEELFLVEAKTEFSNTVLASDGMIIEL
jgi:ribonuclease Z